MNNKELNEEKDKFELKVLTAIHRMEVLNFVLYKHLSRNA